MCLVTAEFDSDQHRTTAVDGLIESDGDMGRDLLDDPVAAVAAAAMLDRLRDVADRHCAGVADFISGNVELLPRPGGPELVAFCAAVRFWEPMAGPVLQDVCTHVPSGVAVQVLAGIENRVRSAVAVAVVDYMRLLGRCLYHDELASAVRSAGGAPLLAELAGLISGSRAAG